VGRPGLEPGTCGLKARRAASCASGPAGAAYAPGIGDRADEFDARATYDDASEDYDAASRDYWEYLSLRAVEHARLAPGDRVLDVPCGAGPSVVAAAEQVGGTGSVLGVDFATRMLAIAADRVAARGLRNVELRAGDMTVLGLDRASFDAVLCVLGIFFVDDMAATLRSLHGLLKPGGRLVVAVLGVDFFSPMRDVFVDAVAAVRPDVEVQQPWRRTEDADVFRALFAAAGIGPVEIASARDTLPLPSAGDWWRIVRGTGLRATVTALTPAQAEAVRDRCASYVDEHRVAEVVLGTHIAVAGA
jgi:ubiquinone/menaquinone biosynthesis C-methylase UbiE